MKTTLKVFSIINIVIGFLAIIGGEGEYYSLVGGLWLVSTGVIGIIITKEV